MRRTTRSQSRQKSLIPAPTAQPLHQPMILKTTPTPPNILFTLPSIFTPKLTGLSRASATLLNTKRAKLRASIPGLRRTFASSPQLVLTLDATLVFAQEEAGTAVCISASGLVLTCAHCVADDATTALDSSNAHWLIFAAGTVARASCVAWDAKRDLALLQITHSEPLAPLSSSTCPSPSATSTPSSSSKTPFPHATVAERVPRVGAPLYCIGHPGSEDLEASTPGTKTGYDVLHVSEGTYRGLAPGADPQDNSEIGGMMHDCWTYWGHSGAPVLDAQGGGGLVGLHSSWDEETGMRRGVPGEAVRGFLGEWTDFETKGT
ncbi:hypothetical protein DPSP01_010129 [Paraphaeosphaeria sporulosa]|uniref:Trypsin-like serine protease n=1 Tax=Paraphaeosphaeria sporulosa TaxID=1460663 RepID=A0A177D0F4_9PLEO|nr:trypsin-like serine protease [Paraphaeosphaeria sporulosa]OAG12610.1 trypsin-like serine protease [Paraphaeosphaeria sporulosa]